MKTNTLIGVKVGSVLCKSVDIYTKCELESKRYKMRLLLDAVKSVPVGETLI